MNYFSQLLTALLPVLLLSVTACSQNANTSAKTAPEGSAPAATATAPAKAAAGAPASASREGKAVATFASGCFWCSEEVFEQLLGVSEVVSGYSGGTEEEANYRQVSSGTTGHAEAIQIWYDPAQISYRQLLQVFFDSHDPTTLNRQGPDVGTQYRSAIFYRTPQEQQQAREYIAEVNRSGAYSSPIVTEVVPFEEFYEAEKYHQNYYPLNQNDPYIRSVSRPKVEKVQKKYKDLLKPERQ